MSTKKHELYSNQFRGTGRTTKMLDAAIEEVRGGKQVAVMFTNNATAQIYKEQVREKLGDAVISEFHNKLTLNNTGTIEFISEALASNLRGSRKVVFRDHTVTGLCQC